MTAPLARSVITAAIAAACLLPGATAHATSYPQGFEARAVGSGLSQPVAIAWAPDGRMFVAEKFGEVRVIETGGTTSSVLVTSKTE